jgi:hypothetical protein
MPLPSDETTPPVMKMNLVMGVEEAVEGDGPYPPTSYQKPRNGSMQMPALGVAMSEITGARAHVGHRAARPSQSRTGCVYSSPFRNSTKHTLSALRALGRIGRRRRGLDRCRIKMMETEERQRCVKQQN